MKQTNVMQTQRQRLADWLNVWQLDQRLAAVPEAPADLPPAPQSYPAAWTVARRSLSSCTIGTPAQLQAGDIVLLPPDSPALRSRPVYVALIEAMCDATWLVVPFGRLPLPALPGELATEHQAVPLRVLCVWNTATLAASRLTRGWHVGCLRLREHRWVRLLLNSPAEKRLTPALKNRLGPPLVHPLDPRHDYLEQERLLWVQTDAIAQCGEMPADYETDKNAGELPLAAEKHEDDYH